MPKFWGFLFLQHPDSPFVFLPDIVIILHNFAVPPVSLISLRYAFFIITQESPVQNPIFCEIKRKPDLLQVWH